MDTLKVLYRIFIATMFIVALSSCASSGSRRDAWPIKWGEAALDKVENPQEKAQIKSLSIAWIANTDMKISTQKKVPVSAGSAYRISEEDKLAAFMSTDKVMGACRTRLPQALQQIMSNHGISQDSNSKFILTIRPIQADYDAGNRLATAGIIFHVKLVNRVTNEESWRLAFTTSGSSQINLQKIVDDSAKLIVDTLISDEWIGT
jgi:hypothetical protein